MGESFRVAAVQAALPEPRRLRRSSVDHISRSELLQKLPEECNQEHQIIAICQHFTRTAMRSLADEAM